MRKASSSLLVFLFAVLFVTLEAHARRSEMMSERIQQTLRAYERMALTDALRVHPMDARGTEVVSLSLQAQSFRGKGQLDVVSNGRVVGSLLIKRQLNDATLQLTPPVDLESLELTATEDIFIDTVTAEVKKSFSGGWIPAPGPTPYPAPAPAPFPERYDPYERQPQSYTTLTLYGMQESRGYLDVDLAREVRSQLGYTLRGAEVESVTIEGGPAFGRSASVQVIVNNRSMGERQLPSGRQVITLGVNTREEIRDLRLVVRGDARLESIRIKIGNVRTQTPPQRAERVSVREEISNGRSLELSRLLPYENRMVTSITLEARTRFSSAEVALIGFRGEFLGSAIVSQSSFRTTIYLSRPTSVRDLRLQSFTPVTIDALELEFERFSRY